MTTRRSFLLAGLTGLTILVAACGGSTGSAAAPTGAATTDEPTTSPAPSLALPSVDASAIVLPSFDPSTILENLEGIDSYRIEMSTDGEVGYSAVVVTKPELARDIRLGTGDDAQHLVVIDDEAWTEAAGTWQPLPSQLASTMLMAFDPVLMAGGFAQPGAWTGAADQGIEERNGVQARHFQIEAGSLIGSLASMPPGASIDAWIAEDGGYLVALEVVGEGGSGFVIDVSGVNDPANVVERPA